MPKTLRNVPIRSWEAGDNVQGFALLTKKELRQDRNGKSFLDLELADASGSIVAKIWSDSPALNSNFETHQFVAFRDRAGSMKSGTLLPGCAIGKCVLVPNVHLFRFT